MYGGVKDLASSRFENMTNGNSLAPVVVVIHDCESHSSPLTPLQKTIEENTLAADLIALAF